MIGSAGGDRTPRIVPTPFEAAIERELTLLDMLEHGLGTTALAYVRSGAHAHIVDRVHTVISSPNRFKAPFFPFLKAFREAETERRALFARGDLPDIATLRRCLEVVAVLRAEFGGGLRGSDQIAPLARVLVSEIESGIHHLSMPPHGHYTPDWSILIPPLRMVEVVEALGGSLADVFDLALEQAGTAMAASYFRNRPEIEALFAANPQLLATVMPRLASEGRIAAIAVASRNGFVDRPEFQPVWLDYLSAGAGAKERDAAISILAALASDSLAPIVRSALATSGADIRLALVEVAARHGSAALQDVLRDRLVIEKTAKVRARIEAALEVAEAPVVADESADHYVAVDGRSIAIPPMPDITIEPAPDVTAEFRADYLAAIAFEDERRAAARATGNVAERDRRQVEPVTDAERDALFDLMTAGTAFPEGVSHFLAYSLERHKPGRDWLKAAIDRLPEMFALDVAVKRGAGVDQALGPFYRGSQDHVRNRLRAYIESPQGDLRVVEAIEQTIGRTSHFGTDRSFPFARGDGLRRVLQFERNGGWRNMLEALPHALVWPYLASNLQVFDEALGLAPADRCPLNADKAILVLRLLPALPARYYPFMLETAVAAAKPLRLQARALLKGATGLDERLRTLLDDARQAVRIEAATWLADLRAAGAAPALLKRLAREKSDPVRTALISALHRLGADLSAILGQKALIAEADAGMKAGKAAPPDWLSLEAMPAIRFNDGSPAPRTLLAWWIALATRLKDPAATGRFGIYLDQLDAGDARAISAWLLESWIAWDTQQPSLDEANAFAVANVDARHRQYQHWYGAAGTYDHAFADLKREKLAEMPNSATDAKGLLALACRAEPVWAAQRVRWYLKTHGRRSSQAAALLDMLAGNATPTALQVVIAASVRLKQKSVQKHAGELVTRFAEDRGWSIDELADRTIPTAGFDDDGVLALPCGDDARPYSARLVSALTIALTSPQGKTVAGLPAGDDETTKESKKALANAKKELKQIVEMQSGRLHEAMCAGRTWPAADWIACFHDHPVMRRMIERLVWEGLDAEGMSLGLFRPTPEGDFTNAADDRVDIAAFHAVRLAHGAVAGDEAGAAWLAHLRDYEVKPLLPQFGRTRMITPDADRDRTEIDDRKGWVGESLALRGVATKLGYERIISDGGGCNEYEKGFPGIGMVAVIEHSGSHAVDENNPVALKALRFRRIGDGRYDGAVVKLGDVPPVLLAECWSDFHAMADKGWFDPEWEKKAPW